MSGDHFSRQAAYDAMLAVKDKAAINDDDYAMADAIHDALAVPLDADDRAFLRWCHERFIVFRESPNLDWMQRLASLAKDPR